MGLGHPGKICHRNEATSMAEFERSVVVSGPLDEVFDFLLRPQNVVRISPPEMGLNFVSAPEVVELGSLMEFKVLARGHVQHITHEITILDRPTRFVEKQVQGPFKQWVHEHAFEPTGDGVTIIDRISFQPPGGLIGLLVNEKTILDSLDDGFAHRHEQLQKILGGAS